MHEDPLGQETAVIQHTDARPFARILSPARLPSNPIIALDIEANNALVDEETVSSNYYRLARISGTASLVASLVASGLMLTDGVLTLFFAVSLPFLPLSLWIALPLIGVILIGGLVSAVAALIGYLKGEGRDRYAQWVGLLSILIFLVASLIYSTMAVIALLRAMSSLA